MEYYRTLLLSRGGAEPETAVQRYNRLKCEASELWEEVNGMKNEAATGRDKKKSTAAAAGDINSVGVPNLYRLLHLVKDNTLLTFK